MQVHKGRENLLCYVAHFFFRHQRRFGTHAARQDFHEKIAVIDFLGDYVKELGIVNQFKDVDDGCMRQLL